tara:strand:- start:778 stop:912 length:135 start_codon:yes stop_codon:yes gene_type:complete
MAKIEPRLYNDIIATQVTETSADEKTKISTIFADIIQRIKDANS